MIVVRHKQIPAVIGVLKISPGDVRIDQAEPGEWINIDIPEDEVTFTIGSDGRVTTD